MTCGCITFVGLINIVIKKISYRKSVLPINVPTISAQIAERFPIRCSRAVGRSENPGVPVLFDGHNLPPLVEIGLTDLPKFGGAMAPPAPPGTTGLIQQASK